MVFNLQIQLRRANDALMGRKIDAGDREQIGDTAHPSTLRPIEKSRNTMCLGALSGASRRSAGCRRPIPEFDESNRCPHSRLGIL